MVKFNSSGRELWRRQFGSLGDDVVLAIATDEAGNIYLTGQTGGNLDGHQNTGGIDLFVVKYDIGGSLQWSQQWGTSGHDLECGHYKYYIILMSRCLHTSAKN